MSKEAAKVSDVKAKVGKDMAAQVAKENTELLEVEEIKGTVQTKVRVTVEIQGSERPACVIDTISRYYPKDSATSTTS